MIECPTKRAPEDGVEELTARICIVNGEGVDCSDSCPGEINGVGVHDENCKCGNLPYKQGRTIRSDKVCPFSSSSTPLATLTALVKFNHLVITYNTWIDLSRLEQKALIHTNLDLLPKIQKAAPLHNASKNSTYVISVYQVNYETLNL